MQLNVQNHRLTNLLNLYPIDIRRQFQTRYLLLDRYDLNEYSGIFIHHLILPIVYFMIFSMSVIARACPCYPRRWGRNECVTNEPQRTSAGRLIFQLIKRNAACPIFILLCSSSHMYFYLQLSFLAQKISIMK